MTEDHNKQRVTGEPLDGEGDEQILMLTGSIRPGEDACHECWVSRGMPAISTDGQEVGWVAAIELNAAGKSTGVVMARPHMTLEYYHLPLSLIGSVGDGQVRLRIRAEAARNLPRRNAGSKPG